MPKCLLHEFEGGFPKLFTGTKVVSYVVHIHSYSFICMNVYVQHAEFVGEAQLLLSSECGAHDGGDCGGGAGINSNLVQRHSL